MKSSEHTPHVVCQSRACKIFHMMDSKSKKYCHSPKLRARGIGAFLGGSTVCGGASRGSRSSARRARVLSNVKCYMPNIIIYKFEKCKNEYDMARRSDY